MVEASELGLRNCNLGITGKNGTELDAKLHKAAEYLLRIAATDVSSALVGPSLELNYCDSPYYGTLVIESPKCYNSILNSKNGGIIT